MKTESTSAQVKRGKRHRTAPPQPTLSSTVSALLAVLVAGLFVQTFVLQSYRIPSASMVPTMQIGDFVLVTKTTAEAVAGAGLWSRVEHRILPFTKVHRGDLVVFHFPPDPRRELVKRIVALPGERLRLHGGRVYLGGQPLPEEYVLFTPSQPEVFRDEFPNLREADPDVDPRWWRTLRRLGVHGELVVPPGCYFVLGDNRNNSEDSRYWGFVPQTALVGRPLLVYFAAPNGADAPAGGPVERLRWLAGWVRGRVGVLH